jgi:hypothetical protein
MIGKIKRGQVYKNRAGNQVRIICTNRIDENPNMRPVVGLLRIEGGREVLATYSEKGENVVRDSGYDLVQLISSPTYKTKNKLMGDLAPIPSRFLIAFWNKNNGKTRFFKANSMTKDARDTLGPGWVRMPLLDK